MDNQKNDPDMVEIAHKCRTLTAMLTNFATVSAEMHDMRPRELLVAIAMAAVELNFRHAKEGMENSAFESMIASMRDMHAYLVQEYAEHLAEEAQAEAEEARRQGAVQ